MKSPMNSALTFVLLGVLQVMTPGGTVPQGGSIPGEQCHGRNLTQFCHHGECILTNGAPICSCYKNFFGENCDLLDIRVADFTVTSFSIRFTWDTSFNLTGFVVLHYLADSSDAVVNIQEAQLSEDGRSLTCEGLQSDEVKQILCVVTNETGQGITDTELKTSVMVVGTQPNCVNVYTDFDRFSIYGVAAQATGAVMCLLILLLCCLKGYKECRDREVREKLLDEIMGKITQMNRLRKRSRKHPDKTKQERDMTDTSYGGEKDLTNLAAINVEGTRLADAEVDQTMMAGAEGDKPTCAGTNIDQSSTANIHEDESIYKCPTVVYHQSDSGQTTREDRESADEATLNIS